MFMQTRNRPDQTMAPLTRPFNVASMLRLAVFVNVTEVVKIIMQLDGIRSNAMLNELSV